MISGQVQSVSISSLAGAKAKAYMELLKIRLSMLVAFSCAFGYGLATHGNVNWTTLFMLTLGGFLLSGASGCINQIIERDFDKMMSRTMKRPLPTGRITVNEAIICSILCFDGVVQFRLYTFEKSRPRCCFCWGNSRCTSTTVGLDCSDWFHHTR